MFTSDGIYNRNYVISGAGIYFWLSSPKWGVGRVGLRIGFAGAETIWEAEVMGKP